ncbi:hypothetical protein pb186bvf_008948 [Paramecium bursaria]
MESCLLKEQAVERFKIIEKDSVHYDLLLQLDKGQNYSGEVTIHFRLNIVDTLYLDFRNQEITKLVINGQEIQQIQKNNAFVFLPKEFLNNQNNVVNLKFTHKYLREGLGIHTFTDIDGEQYLYTQCEAYFCNRIFPCFDQPDIRSTIQFTAVTSKEWKVISNTYLIEPTEEHNDSLIHKFQKTQRIPCYLFAFAAGNYYQIDAKGTKIPQSIYSRQSLKGKLIEFSDFVIETTAKALDFYEDYFQIPYQFVKYDTVFTAEFFFYAMENPGCVTVDDRFISYEKPTKKQIGDLIHLLTHEIAHMWFGNYVTLRWWNDVWLNESFAEFFSHHCSRAIKIESKESEQVDVALYSWKSITYFDDQLSISHPICSNIKDAQFAMQAFDHATYHRGDAILRILCNEMGYEKFRYGIQTYFNKYKWSNTDFDDFVQTLKESTGHDIEKWLTQWVNQRGFNQIYSEIQEGKVIIRQESLPKGDNFLREIKLYFQYYNETGRIGGQHHTIKAEQVQEIQIPEGTNALTINGDNGSYVKLLYDHKFIEFFTNHFQLFHDLMERITIYESLLFAVLDGNLTAKQLTDVLEATFQNETNQVAQKFIFQFIRNHLIKYVSFPLAETQRIHKFLLNFLKQNPDNLVIQYNLIKYVSTIQDIEQLIAIQHQKEQQYKQIVFGQKSQFQIVLKALQVGLIKNQDQLNQIIEQFNLDESSLKQIQLYAPILFVDQDLRSIFVSEFVKNERNLSLRQQLILQKHFNQFSRQELLKKHNIGELFFEGLQHVLKEQTIEYFQKYLTYLYPYYLPPDVLKNNLIKFKENNQGFSHPLITQYLDLTEFGQKVQILQ